MERDDLKAVLEEVLHQKRTIDEETHITHHRFVQRQIERDERRQELFRRFRLSFVGGLAMAVLGFLGWLGTLIVGWFKSTGGHQ